MKASLFIISLLCVIFNAAAQDVPNLMALGNQAVNNGAYRDAETYYRTALSKEPQNWNIHTMLGFSIHKQKRFREADSIYRMVLQNDSLSSKTHWYKGMNHVAMRQDSLGILHYKRFIQLEKNRGGSLVQAYRTIGQCYERMLKQCGLYSWQIDDMIYHYEQVELADPSFPDVPLIRSFIETVQSKRPAQQTSKWKMEP